MDTSPARAKPEADRLDKVFVLVHGTWASKAEWIEPESDFAKRLTSKVPYSRTSAFRWTGRNSDRARRDAGKKLAEHTANLRRERPDTEIVVVGHSHGGNVALNAYREPCGQQSIEKIVCLGTPFFRFRARELKPASNMIATGLIAILCLGFLLDRASQLWTLTVLQTVTTSNRPSPDPDDPTDFSEDDLSKFEVTLMKAGYALIFFAVLPPLAFLFVRPIAWLCEKGLQPLQRTWLRDHAPPISNPPTLVLYTTGDEARGWLWFIERVWRPVFTGLFVFGQILTKALLLAIPLAFIAVAKSISQENGTGFFPYFGAFGNVVLLIGFTYISTLAAFVLSLLAAVYGSLVAGAPWGFGSAGLISYQLIAVKAVEWPIQTPCVDAALVTFEGPRSFGTLLHSSFYTSEVVIDHICSWIAGEHFGPPANEAAVTEKRPLLLGRRRQWLYAIVLLITSWLLWELLLKLL